MSIPGSGAVTRALAAAALAVSIGAASAAGAEARWYDGNEVRSITVQPDLVAALAQDPARSRVLAAHPGAMSLPGVGDSAIGIYRLPRIAARTADAPGAAAAGLPVYREGNSPAGRLMTLPGGALVKFRPEWSREQVDAFVAARGLAVERRLAIAGNWFLVATPPGNASLAAANAMFESGEVLAASPNWWRQTSKR